MQHIQLAETNSFARQMMACFVRFYEATTPDGCGSPKMELHMNRDCSSITANSEARAVEIGGRDMSMNPAVEGQYWRTNKLKRGRYADFLAPQGDLEQGLMAIGIHETFEIL